MELDIFECYKGGGHSQEPEQMKKRSNNPRKSERHGKICELGDRLSFRIRRSHMRQLVALSNPKVAVDYKGGEVEYALFEGIYTLRNDKKGCICAG